MTDKVIIAGAGPAGLMLACELGLFGVDAVVVERTPEPRIDAPGVAVNATTIELLDQRGLMDELREGAFPLPTEHFGFVFMESANPGRPHENTLLLLQQRLETRLEKRARELGVEFRRGVELTGIRPDEDGVTVELRGADGATEELRGSYLVGCDGRESVVRTLSGIEFEGVDAVFHGIVGEVEIEHSELQAEHIGVHHRPTGGHFLGAPLEPGLFRVMSAEFGYEPPADDVPVDLEELREATVRLTGVDLKATGIRWLTRYPNTTRNAERYSQGRVFLAGDAAHVHYPFNGQGIGTGVHDAVNLGWKLAATLRGRAPKGLLDTYHAERHPVGQAACDNVRAQVSLCHPPQEMAPLRAIIGELTKFDNVRRYLLDLVTGLSVRYPSDQEDAHPLTGRRLPHAELVTADGATSIPALLRAGQGVLLDLTGGLATPYTAETEGLEDQVTIVFAQATPCIEAEAVLLRPDGHVAWAADTDRDPEGLRTALATWFAAPTACRGAAPRTHVSRLP
ncbi:FAD-dependent monooxygenase [Kitasatospora sp. NPDC057015]|uniref:FAD-dependent monooxygenase n=1 Tax=Kitasatospora sp. NPDC057015 TaxID=3346001 RepID=UPI00362A7AC5